MFSSFLLYFVNAQNYLKRNEFNDDKNLFVINNDIWYISILYNTRIHKRINKIYIKNNTFDILQYKSSNFIIMLYKFEILVIITLF